MGAHDGRRDVVQAILQYLSAHPEAKDTIEGIRQWWLSPEWDKQGEEVVQAALNLLVSRGWVTARVVSAPRRMYGLNPARLDEITTALRGLQTGGELPDRS